MTLAFFACAVLAALVVAHFAREERTAVVRIAWVVAINWLLFASYWIYAPASPAYLIYDAGVAWGVKLPVTLLDTWAITDLLSLASVIAIAHRFWWCAFFVATYFAMLTMLAVAYVTGLEYLDYRYFLDVCLVVQLAVFLLLGGDGCADYLSSQWRVHRSRMVVRASVDRPQGSKQ